MNNNTVRQRIMFESNRCYSERNNFQICLKMGPAFLSFVHNHMRRLQFLFHQHWVPDYQPASVRKHFVHQTNTMIGNFQKN